MRKRVDALGTMDRFDVGFDQLRIPQSKKLLNLEERHSYKNDYIRFLEQSINNGILLIILVGAGRFERPTPCAQDG